MIVVPALAVIGVLVQLGGPGPDQYVGKLLFPTSLVGAAIFWSWLTLFFMGVLEPRSRLAGPARPGHGRRLDCDGGVLRVSPFLIRQLPGGSVCGSAAHESYGDAVVASGSSPVG